jgi:hypothetical protein
MRVMIVIRVLSATAVVTMALIIAVGFATASFTADGAAIMALAWGRVTLVDLAWALLLGWLWIAWREASPLRAAGWLVATVVTGSLALFGYLLLASLRAEDTTGLVLGPKRGG